MKKKNPLQADPVFLIGIIVYSILAVILIKYYRYEIDIDGVSFIGIAEKYARGDFANAINGFWGPLLSWLLVPFLKIGLVPTYAVKVIAYSTGLLTLIGIRLLSYKFSISQNIRNLVWFLLIPHILYFASVMINPDWLSVCLLVYYLNLIFDPDYSSRRTNGFLCGLLGGLAYLCKNYNFFFFILHFPLFNLFQYLRNEPAKRMKVIQNLIIGIMVFSIISGPWIMLISNKYHEITVGTAGKNAYSVTYYSYAEPDIDVGFLEPPNDTALSAQEDPTYIKMKPWSPFRSLNNFILQLKIIAVNIDLTVKSYLYFTLLAPAIILGYLLLLLMSYKKLVLQGELLYPLTTLILYTSGYIPISLYIPERHLWLNDVLMALMGGYLLHVLFQNSFFNAARKNVTLVIFALSFIAIPVDLFRPVMANRYIGRDTYELSKTLKDKYNIRGKMASNGMPHEMISLSFYLNNRFYGIHNNIQFTDEALLKKLLKHDVNYYFIWDKEKNRNSLLLSNYKELTGGEIPDLKIYYLKEKIR